MRQDALLGWYDARRRALPWRAEGLDPYRTWLSEIMLQQTRVDVVVGYYERFTARFPTVTALADAPLDDVLTLWSGLGYYARARNLHAASKVIRDEHGGKFPSEPDAVRALPGVGRYTAGAILSIAFGKKEPLVDGNVVRVLARMRMIEGHAKAKPLHDECWRVAAELVAEVERPGDFNQALMELGATVCTPASPKCGECPVAESCRARAEGKVAEFPAKAPKAKRKHRVVDAALVMKGGRVLLVRRPDKGLLGGMWELPSAERGKGKAARAGEGLAVPGLVPGLDLRVGERAAATEHTFSHFDMTLEAFACEATGTVAASAEAARWVAREELVSYGIGAAMRRVLEAALK